MKLNSHSAPHIRYHENTRTLMGDVILPMLVIYTVVAVFYYGTRVVALGLTSVAAALLTDWVCTLLAGRKPNPRDWSAIVTGLILPLLMPASIGFPIVVTAAVFGIAVAKHPFGGVGHNVFNPAAAGFAFVSICFDQTMFRYPQPLDRLSWFLEEAPALTVSPSFILNVGGVPNYDFVQMALGQFPGPVGATNILVILACLLYLISRGAVRWRIPVFYLVTAGALAWLFPRSGLDPLDSFRFEMMSGMLLFGGVFMLGDPVTSPKRGWSQAAYGIAAGVLLMLFRHFGKQEGEFVFALLIMNATVWGFDMLGERFASFIRGKKIEYFTRSKVSKKA